MIHYVFIFFLCCVIYIDATKKKIFNEFSLICIFFGFLFLEEKKFSHGLVYSCLSSGIVFIVLMVFYRMKFMGAGDVKFGAALAFCLGLSIFFEVWVISVFLSVIYSLSLRFFLPLIYQKGWVEATGIQKRKNVPYGAMLSMATIFLILRG